MLNFTASGQATRPFPDERGNDICFILQDYTQLTGTSILK